MEKPESFSLILSLIQGSVPYVYGMNVRRRTDGERGGRTSAGVECMYIVEQKLNKYGNK